MTNEEVVVEMYRLRAYNRGWDACGADGSFDTGIYRRDSAEYKAYQDGWLAYARRVIENNKKTS